LQKLGRIQGDLLKTGTRLIYSDAVIYSFDSFDLDLAKSELRQDGKVCALEPQVLALLVLLVENRDRLVTRDEIIEKVWDGRIVSDSAVSSRIKSVRQILGDDGKSQRLIKTLHRRGFRFVSAVRASMGPTDPAAAIVESGTALPPAPRPVERRSRPSIAVLQFSPVGDLGPLRALTYALPHELIADLARLRWLFVTARNSSFRLHPSDTDLTDIGRLLGVRYCLTGTVEVAVKRLVVTAELADTVNLGVVWTERFERSIDDVHALREEICACVLSALELRIPLHEAELAQSVATEKLDAWSAYHLGLQHAFRFNRVDNAAATSLFQNAIALDPGFARAHAGLSFTHFQTAFLRQTDDVAGEVRQARRFAERGVELDSLDPFVNFAMGRTFWLDGDLASSLVWLERSTLISPNYAQGIYARAWTESLAGSPLEGRNHVDLAMRLSPLDPLFYGMLGTRAFTHMAVGEDAAAAAWAERAARAPGAHVLIAMIACALHSLAGDRTRADAWAANVRERNHSLTLDDFLRAFPMKSEQVRMRVTQALGGQGF